MKIGLTYTARKQSSAAHAGESWANCADDEEEFDSPETVQAIADAVASHGHEVELLGDGEQLIKRLLSGPRPDLVLNIAEGRGGTRSREARVPALLETLGIPYTGSDPLTLAATLDKDCAKRLVASYGIATPGWALFQPGGDAAARQDFERRLTALPWPLIVKPAYEGSSKGVLAKSVVENRAELDAALNELTQVYRQPVLVEEFIEGDELTVGIVGHWPTDVVGIMRVLPRQETKRFVYSLEVKRDWEAQVRYECPAQLTSQDDQSVRQAALTCWRALGCRDVARVDFRLRAGVPYFLETNPLPGLSPKSGDLVLLSRAMGIEHRDLIGRILTAAYTRLRLGQS